MNVPWKKYPLSQEIWEKEFAHLDQKGRIQFLTKHEFVYKQVPKCESCNKVFFNCMCEDSPYNSIETRTEYKEKKDGWRAEIAKSFEEKLKYSEELLARKMDVARRLGLKYALGYSGGIDSECCLQLCADYVKEGIVLPIFGNTTSELPDTYKRISEAEKEMGVKFLRSIPECGVTFELNAIKYGLPIYPRNEGLESLRVPTKKCCNNLKEKPQHKMLKGYDGDGVLLGLKESDGRGRGFAMKRMGDCWIDTNGVNQIRPIGWWTIDDEWKYQELKGFKYNAIYDKTNMGKKGFYRLKNKKIFQIRSGCAFCPQGIYNGYLEWLYEYYPTYYERLVKIYNNVAEKRGDGITFDKVLEIKKVKRPDSNL